MRALQTGNSIFYGTVLLTGSNLLLRLILMSFQVFLSGRIGAAGMGLLQLTFSLKELAFTLGSAGIRTCAVYLTAESLGRGRAQDARAVLRGCFRYALALGSLAALGLWHFAPLLAESWVGDRAVLPALRICALFLPLRCLGSVLDAYCTSLGRIRELIFVEFLEQGCSMAVTVFFLARESGMDSGQTCSAVALGNGAACAVGFCALLLLQRTTPLRPATASQVRPPYRRILRISLPLGLTDNLRSGLNTVENLIIPKRLVLFAGTVNAMADYGIVHGMVFPVLMLPAAILFSLSSLLIPEFSRCAAGHRQPRVRYLARRSLRTALLYGLAVGSVLFSLARPLGELLYHEPDAGTYLRLYAPLVPLLYTDIVTDAVCKGLGHQDANARYNLLTSFLDVAFLWYLLPRLGLGGYFLSFAVTHLVNFLLSFRRLVLVSGIRMELSPVLRAAVCTVAAALAAELLPQGGGALGLVLSGSCCLLLLLFLWTLLRVIGPEDFLWLRTIFRQKPAPHPHR